MSLYPQFVPMPETFYHGINERTMISMPITGWAAGTSRIVRPPQRLGVDLADWDGFGNVWHGWQGHSHRVKTTFSYHKPAILVQQAKSTCII